jgi:XTP/dITP diphosphohydrolase
MTEKKTLVAATTNEHKIREIGSIAGSFGYAVISRADAGVPDHEIEETGRTFEENSLLKAKVIFDMLGGRFAVVADDSGIEVDALEGAPGVYSARFADDHKGEGRTNQDKANNAKLLRLIEDVPMEKRTARFVSVITCVMPDKPPIICRGEVEGHVDFKETGGAGFGYDPLFIPLGFDRSFGLFSAEDKNAISHRGRALAKLAENLAAESG